MILKERKKIFFIINPIAGGKDKSSLISKISSKIDSTTFDARVSVTKSKENLVDLVNYAIGNNYYGIVAIGGDGTVNMVASEILKQKAKVLLGIIPLGSGNGLARSLNIPRNLNKALNAITNLNFTYIDVININGSRSLNVAGLGFEALVAKRFSTIITTRGIINYIKLIIKLYKNYEPIKINLILHNKKNITMRCFSLSLANGSQFGNNIFIAPAANINDGLLDLVIMKKMKIRYIPKVLYQLFTKKINNSKYITTIKTKSVYLESDNDLVHVDGEPLICRQPIIATIESSALKVIIP